jgi:hypothetical protein
VSSLQRHSFLVATLLSIVAGRALAQSAPNPSEKSAHARIRIGPLALDPTLALTNAGVDTNVFNQPDALGPKRDFTITVTPVTDLWLRLGRSWLTGALREDLVYYNTYVSERSVNHYDKVGLLLPLNRLTLTAGIDYVSVRDRPGGFEIDARSQRYETGFSGSAEIRWFPKTFIGVRGDRRTVKFDSFETFAGVNLHDALSRTDTTGAITVRYHLSPLTELNLDVSREQDRFKFSSFRDSNSTQISAGVKLDPFALIKGSASFGYRNFQPLSAEVTPYQGSTAAVNLSYVALGTTRVAVQSTRDVQYSYDINQPYYVLTGATVSIAQEIFGPVDVVGHVGAHRLDYQARAGAVVGVSERTDHIRMYGAGIGYRMGREVRLGFNVDQWNRTSAVEARRYHGLRFGTSVTYGF